MTYPVSVNLLGKVKASDYVWSLAAGFPGNRRERVFVVLQLCLDESGKGDPDLMVMAGYLSTTEKWGQFSDEWQKHLDYDSAHYRKLEYFKMAEMTSNRDRERCAWFYRVIENHAMMAVSFTISIKDLKREIEALPNPEEAGYFANPWYFAALSLIPVFIENMPTFGLTGPIDFVFDELSDKTQILSSWDAFKVNYPQHASMVAGTPIFRPDHKYVPLQAADLLAWWVRHWQVDGLKRREIYQCEFPWKVHTPIFWNHISAGQKEIRGVLQHRVPLGKSVTTSPWASPPLRSS
jgi:Protein of unknown function (DUF3800)